MHQSITGGKGPATVRPAPTPAPRALTHRPAAKSKPARQPQATLRIPTSLSEGPKTSPTWPLSATSERTKSGRYGRYGRERSSRMAQPKRDDFQMGRNRGEKAAFGNGYAGDGKSIRLDDLESSRLPDDPDCIGSCVWRYDPRLRSKDIGRQQHDSRVRENGVIVFDCGHTSSPTRRPLLIPPVTYHHFDNTGYPVPYRHVCHDCSCHDRFMAQRVLIEVNQTPLKILRMNQQIDELIESRKPRAARDVEQDSDIAELRGIVDQIVKARDRDVWSIWEGWEAKWGEKLYMNRLGYVYGPNPVVKGLEYVFPPEDSSRDNGSDRMR